MEAIKNFFSQPTNIYTTAIVAVLIAAYFLFAPKETASAAENKKNQNVRTEQSKGPRKSSRVAGDAAPEIVASPETRGRTGTRSTPTPKRAAR